MKSSQAKSKSPRDVVINLRAKQSQRNLIDRAAESLGKSRSDFLLDAACSEAENVLLDQRIFYLDDAQYKVMMDLLNAPPQKNEKLQALFARKSPWEQ